MVSPTFKTSARRSAWRWLCGLGAATACSLAVAAPASANLEWLGHETGEFPNKESEIKIGNGNAPQGIAVNYSSGDVYEADGSGRRVLRFNKEGRFLEAWGWGVGDGKEEFERCGPAGELAHPTCAGGYGGAGLSGDGNGEFERPVAVAIDQTNGEVFVDSGNGATQPTIGLEQVFTAAGEYLTRFGLEGKESVEQIERETTEPGALAVDGNGTAYVIDNGKTHGPRVMVFEPNLAGEYTYRRDIFKNAFGRAAYLAIDNQGKFYLAADEDILRFDSETAGTPSWQIADSGILGNELSGYALDPVAGEVFAYTFKNDLWHEIRPVGSSEKMEVTFKAAENELQGWAAAYAPTTSFGSRPPGVLYADEPFDTHSKRPPRGLIFGKPASHPPIIDSVSSRAIGTTYATLEAQINPSGFDTRYHFEYGTAGPCAANPCGEAPIGGGDAGVAHVDQFVSVALSKLQPDTTYYYRVVASNQFGEAEEAAAPARTFHTYAAIGPALPDGRAYELVSPAEKHGGEVFPINPYIGSCMQCEPGLTSIKMPMQSAPDGESVAYEGFPFSAQPEGGSGALKENQYRAVRTASGWRTEDLSPERATQGAGFRALTPDLSRGVLKEELSQLVEGALPEGHQDLYIRDQNGLVPLVRELVEPMPGLELEYAAATPDLGEIVFAADGVLTAAEPFAPQPPKPAPSSRELYRWRDGTLQLVSVLPGNTQVAGNAVVGAGVELGNNNSAPNYDHAVSADGARVFWTDLETGTLYVRERGEVTRMIPDAGRCGASPNVCFLAASSDGGKVLLSDGRIYDLTTEPVSENVDLTKGLGGFQGMIGANDSLSVIYFVDTQVLDSQPGPTGAVAKTGADNLYVYNGLEDSTKFIAALGTGDNELGEEKRNGDWQGSPGNRTAQVTGSGRFAAFESIERLTGYNNECAPLKSGGGWGVCPEVFEYDAEAGSLGCVSCNPTGQRPVGGSFLPLIFANGTNLPQPHSLLANGRVLFDSMDTLSANDQNPGIENVYEYEREGQGTCTVAEGCIELLSSGHGNLDAAFLDSDETGKNVFFTTRQQLVPEDHDELVDLYDAREGGGFSQQTLPAQCAGEGCRPPSVPTQAFAPPASATFVGPLNLASRPAAGVVRRATVRKCPKRKVRKHDRCVKRRGKKARRAARSRAGGHVAGRR